MTVKVELGVATGFILDDAVAGVLDNTTYLLGGLTWLDMSAYVYSVSTTRGKNRELDRFNAGTFTVTLRNDGRVFDPYNYTSPFAGNIIPRKQLRVSVDSVVQFVGTVTDWSFDYAVGGESTATVTGTDDFAKLAQLNVRDFTPPEELTGARVGRVLNKTVPAWPSAQRSIDTGSSTVNTDTVMDVFALDYLQKVVDSEQGYLYIGKDGVLNFRDRNTTPKTSGSSTLVRTNLWKWNTVSTNSAKFFNVDGATAATDVYSFTTAYPSGKALRHTFIILAGGMSPRIQILSQPITASIQYLFSMYAFISWAGTVRFSINWYNSLGVGIGSNTGTNRATDGINPVLITENFTAPATAASFEMIVLCDDSGALPGGVDYLEVSSFMVEASTTTYTTYFDGNTDPTLEFYYNWDLSAGSANAAPSRKYQLSGASTQNIFDDKGVHIPYTSAAVNYGSEQLVNQAIVNATVGTRTADNTTSQFAYGLSSVNVDTVLSTAAQLSNVANWLVKRFKDPEYRFEAVTVNVDSLNATNRAAVLAMDIATIAEMQFTPNQTGSPIVQRCMVIGIKHGITPDRHDVTFQFQQLPFTFFVLDDVVWGKLDGVGVLGF
jgi:hypothetical protein